MQARALGKGTDATMADAAHYQEIKAPPACQPSDDARGWVGQNDANGRTAASASPGPFLLGDRQPADFDHDLTRPVEAPQAVFARNHPVPRSDARRNLRGPSTGLAEGLSGDREKDVGRQSP